MNGVKVKIDPNYCGYAPFGFNYEAKGAYIQGNFVIVVGNLKENTSIRMKYPKNIVNLIFF
jgi:hypothetical protein